MKHLLRGVFTAAIVVLLGVTDARAQATAQISGVVSDAQGGVLPGVDVTATQTETGFKRSTVTDANGSYTLPNLPLGPYRLEAMLSGFRAFVRTGLVLQVNANPEVNVTMALGDLNETISVEGSTPLIETRSPSIGAVIENERIEELPLNGRQATDLIVLAGAAVAPGGGANASSRSMTGGVGISVAGGQTFGVAYLLDGAMHNNPYDNLNLPLPFPDAMQEFRVETSSTNANNGMHSGASVNAVTKSGTNAYHGDLFEFFRNHRFNAIDPFARPDPVTGVRPDDGLNRNQFGATFGGPIRHDRLFFFGAYQGTRFRSTPSDNESFVPTAAMLNGDFSVFNSATCGRTVTMRAPFDPVTKRVDPALISPAARAIAAHLPKPEDECGRVQFERTRPVNDHQFIGKVDWQLNSNHTIFGRYMLTNVEIVPPLQLNPENILVSTQGGNIQYAQSLTIGDTRVLSNTTVNALRIASNYTDIHRTHVPIGFDTSDVGIKTFSYLEDYMLVSVTGGFSLGGGTENEARFKTPSYQVTDDLTMVRGDHQLGLGGSLAFWRSLSRANVRSPGMFSFAGNITGLGLADFVIGRLSGNPGFIQAVPNTLDMQQWYVGLYAQDTWKTSPNLTLNYGLRWEPAIAQQIRNGAIYSFDVDRYLAGQKTTVFTNAPPGFLFPGDPGFVNGNAGMYNHWNQWSPRLGVAWDPTGGGTTVVRGGYGLGYDFINAQFHLNTSVAQPWGAEVRLSDGALLDDPFAGSGVANPFPYVLGKDSPFNLFGPYIAIPADIKTPRQQSWNATFQHQFGNTLAGTVSYLGSHSDRMWNVRSLNEGQYIPGSCTLQTPTGPQFFATCTSTTTLNFRRKLTMQNWDTGKYLGAVDEHTALGRQNYNGLMMSVKRTSSRGVSVDANYTVSKCEGHPTQGGTTPNVSTGYTNPNDIDYDYGACATDRRHVFNLTAVYRTPQFDNEILRALASNWRVSGIYRASSGSPIVVTVNNDPAGTGIGGQRANLNGDPYGDRDSITNYLNFASFSAPAPGGYGNQRRGDIYGPGTRNVDLALVRLFRLQTHTIEARLESFNLMNWVRYNNPATNFNAPNTFGRITSAQDMRIMQFALKYQF